MKSKIEIEQFDNGITIKNIDLDSNTDPMALVAMNDDICKSLGKAIWIDAKYLMELHLTNKVAINLEFIVTEEKK